MALRLTTPATVEPITLDDVYARGRITTNADDAYLTNMITACRMRVENWLGRALNTQTWVYSRKLKDMLDMFPVPRPVLQSVVSIQCIDTDGSSTMVPDEYFYIDNISEPGSIWLKPDYTWPVTTTASYIPDAIWISPQYTWPITQFNDQDIVYFLIEFVAGYGPDPTDVPIGIREGIAGMVVQAYDNRALPTNMPPEVAAELQPYRIHTFRV